MPYSSVARVKLVFHFLLAWQIVSAQQSIDVTDQTVKVGGLSEEVIYYAFAEGDKIVFSFQELNGKELKEVEIIELPSSSRFLDYKTKSISERTLNVGRAGIYKFRFSNSALGGRVCKFSIKRIPVSSETQEFNTTVYWRTVYDSAYLPVEERYIENIDTIINNIVDQVAKISSQNALNGNPNKTLVDFELPPNTRMWSFYIGVGSEGKEAYEKAKENFVNTAVATFSKIPGYGSMAALAIYGINTFSKTQGRDNVKYWFITDWENVQRFQTGNGFLQYKLGDVVSDAAQMKSPLAGKVFLALLNDNLFDPIEVVIKVTTVQVKEKYSTRIINILKVTERKIPYINN